MKIDMKKVITLTESEFKSLITESVKKIIREAYGQKPSGGGFYSHDVSVDVMEITFDNPNLQQFFNENVESLPNNGEVKCEIGANFEPGFRGDYDNPPYGSTLSLDEWAVDTDSAFKTYFEEVGMSELYEEFVREVEYYLDENIDDLVDEKHFRSNDDIYGDY